MAYSKFHDPWHDADSALGGGDESTPLTAAALDHIETGIAAAIPDPGSATTAHALVWNGTAWVADTITNARVAANAAIAVSKLAPGSAGQILGVSSGTAAWIAAPFVAISAVTALPGSPTDGQEVIFTDSLTAPTYYWRFRYNSGSSSSYKWEFVGGIPRSQIVTAAENVATTAYSSGTTPLTFTAPLSGEYAIRTSATALFTAASSLAWWAAIQVNAVSIVEGICTTINGKWGTVYTETPLVAATASQVIRVMYKVESGLTVGMTPRSMIVTPLRCS